MSGSDRIRRAVSANPTGALVAVLGLVGAAVGYVLDGVAVGVAIGAMLGAVIGSHVYRRKRTNHVDGVDKTD
ncbi:hypothetical protein BH10PSE17_BH10PSE17_21750 [soil metagenome]